MMTQIHAVPGRLRVRSRALKQDPGSATALNAMLRAIPGVRSVEIRPVTGSIIVHYSVHELSGDSVIQTLASWGFLSQSATCAARPGSRPPESGVKSAATALANRTLELAARKLLERSVSKLIAGLL